MKDKYKAGTVVSAFLMALFLSSCNPNADELLSVGANFAESNTRVVLVDTFSMQLSTILIDSVTTSDAETALVGEYFNEKTGNLVANSFFQIGLPSTIFNYTGGIVDSITLVINYSTYYYGDTTQTFSISINRVTEDIEVFDDGYLYNNSNFSYDDTPLGTKSFIPRPNSSKTIEIRLDDDLANDLYDKLLYSKDEVSSSTNFTNYFKGLVLLSDNNTNKAVLGFGLADSTLKMRIYGHRTDEELENWELDFPAINSSTRFNQIISNRSNTDLESLIEQRTGIPSNQTGNISFVKGGAGIMTGISFPSLGRLLEINRGDFFRAELALRPVINDANSDKLPSDFYMFEAGKYNRLNSAYADSQGSTYYATVETDKLYNESSIIFDVTKFIKYELYDSYYDEEHTLVLTYSDPVFNASCNQIEIGGNGNKNFEPKLNIYYIYYE